MAGGGARGSRFGAIGQALGNRDFAIYTAGNVPSVIGVWIQRVAVGWLTWELTGSTGWLGLMSFADLFPLVVLSPLAGVVADRIDRVRIAKTIPMICAAQALILTVLTLADLITVEIMFLLVLINGAGQSFFQPVRQALVQNLVPRSDLPAAIAVNSIAWNTARFVGPAVAGIILVWGDAALAFAVNATSYMCYVFALRVIGPSDTPTGERSPHGLIGELADGYRYAFRHPVIGPCFVILATVALCGRPVVELLPGFAAAVYGRGPDGLAWLTSSMGIGAMASAFWLGQRGRIGGLAVLAVMSLVAAGVLVAAITTTTYFPIAVACMAGVGVVQVVTGMTIQTIVQTIAVPAMRGRVLATYTMIWMGGASLGALVMGWLWQWFGLHAPFLIASAILIAVWLWAMRIRHGVARLVEEPG
jgi:MFS family permease